MARDLIGSEQVRVAAVGTNRPRLSNDQQTRIKDSKPWWIRLSENVRQILTFGSVKQISPYSRIDHIAIAVEDLEEAIKFHEDALGLVLKERRIVEGKFTGMTSAVMDAGPFTVVLIQGLEPESQVCKYIEKFGPGVQHVAFEVDNVSAVRENLSLRGMTFATRLIRGETLRQTFSQRDLNTGMMYEFIQRVEGLEFEDQSVEILFTDMERGGHI